MRLKKMDMHTIMSMKREGMSVKDIAFVMDTSETTIYNVLRGEHSNQDRIADRMEYFLGGSTMDDGCYQTDSYHDEDRGLVIHDVDVGWQEDPTFEKVAFEEELEQFVENLDNFNEN